MADDVTENVENVEDIEDIEVESPYWHLPTDADPATLRRMLGRLPATIRPILASARRAEPRATVAVLVLQLASGIATASGLLATTSVLTNLLAAGPTAHRVVAALPALALVVAVLSAKGLLDTGVTVAYARIAPSVRWLAEQRLIGAALRAPLASFDNPAFHDQLHRSRDRGLYYLEHAAEALVELVGATVAVVAAAISVSVLHPILLPVLLLAVLPDGWAVLNTARMGYASMTRTVALIRRADMIAELATERAPAAEIRACAAEPFVTAEYRAAADPVRAESVRLGLAQARTRAFGRAMAGVGMAATYATLAVLLGVGWIPLAVAGTAMIAIRATTAALSRLALAANRIFEVGLYIADFEEFVEGPSADAASPDLPPADPPTSIELRGVGFRYPGDGGGRWALAGVDLEIAAGQTIALVGENGSGKTTLAKVICGLYRPSRGAVRWNGVDLTALDRRAVADQVVMVLQDPVRWPHDARTNVTVGRHDRADPRGSWLRRAAELAHADEVVDALSRRWETLLSTQFRGGQDLSGGQWQRLAVARGLYRDAPLLIWDEPTAPLDAKAEFAVYESLRKLANDRTVVLITHRLASVRHADRIYLLHEGSIVERGTHEELYAAGGRYTELYDLQAQLFFADPKPAA